MRRLRVIFTKPKMKFPLVSWAIRLFTWSKFSHCVWGLDGDDKHRENFHVFFNEPEYISDRELYDKNVVVSMFSILIPDAKFNLIKGRCDRFNGITTKGYLLQILGAFLMLPYRWLHGSWANNPLSFGNSYLCSQYIMEDLMKTLDLYLYVSTYWVDSLDGLDTFTEKDLYNFLTYVEKLDQNKLPVKITRVY